MDNSFWVSFDEFIYQFEYVAICHTRNYQKTIVKGKFQQAFDDAVSDQNSVISKFYYTLNIQKDDTEVILGIQQEDDSAIGWHLRQLLDASIVVLAEDTEDIWLWDFSEFNRDRDTF